MHRICSLRMLTGVDVLRPEFVSNAVMVDSPGTVLAKNVACGRPGVPEAIRPKGLAVQFTLTGQKFVLPGGYSKFA